MDCFISIYPLQRTGWSLENVMTRQTSLLVGANCQGQQICERIGAKAFLPFVIFDALDKMTFHITFVMNTLDTQHTNDGSKISPTER